MPTIHISSTFCWRTRNGEDPLERRKEPRYLLNHKISKGSDTISTELIDILSKSCNPNGLRYLGVTSMPMFSLRSTRIPLNHLSSTVFQEPMHLLKKIAHLYVNKYCIYYMICAYYMYNFTIEPITISLQGPSCPASCWNIGTSMAARRRTRCRYRNAGTNQSVGYIHWIGLRENLQETMVFTIKYRAFL